MDEALHVKPLYCFQERHSRSKIKNKLHEGRSCILHRNCGAEGRSYACTRTVKLISTLSSYLQEFQVLKTSTHEKVLDSH